MSKPPFVVRRIRWWHKPVRLAAKRGDGFEFIGWVWNQTAYLVRNLNHGYIAFVEDQTPEKIDVWKCDHCGAEIGFDQRRKIEGHLKGGAA